MDDFLVGLIVLAMLGFVIGGGFWGVRLIRGGISDRSELETAELLAAGQVGHDARRGQLLGQLTTWLIVLGISVSVMTWAIVVLVDSMQHAPYDFSRQQVGLPWWPPLLTLFSTAGTIIAAAKCIGKIRRLKALASTIPKRES
jgi:hypothetical protein